METPELDFLLYLLTRFAKNNDLDPEKTTLQDVYNSINLNLTPIGGG